MKKNQLWMKKIQSLKQDTFSEPNGWNQHEWLLTTYICFENIYSYLLLNKNYCILFQS